MFPTTVTDARQTPTDATKLEDQDWLALPPSYYFIRTKLSDTFIARLDMTQGKIYEPESRFLV